MGFLLLASLALTPPDYRNASLPVERRVADLLHRMTLEEKARQLDMYLGAEFVDAKNGGYQAAKGAHFVPANADKTLGSLGVGSIHDLYPNAGLYNEIQRWVIGHSRLGIPAMFIEEGLHGFSNMDGSGTVYPESINLASTWDPKMAQATGAGIAAEARASGIDLLLCPVLDVAREPRWGRVEEDFGEDPYLTGELGAAYVHGMQGDSLDTDHTVVSEPKHFAGHGSPESGLNTAPLHAGEREVRSIMLRSFEPAIRRSHAMGAMAAYHEIDGVPVTANPWLLTDVLRGEWGFKGIVISDLGAIQRLYDIHHVAATPEDAVRLALTSGVDMQFYDFGHDVYQGAIVDGVKEHKLNLSAVDRAVTRVLRVKFMLGLFDHPYVDAGLAPRTMRSVDHLATMTDSAKESMVLLRNEGKLLPLSKSIGRVAVIGPNAAPPRLGDYSKPEGDIRLIGVLDGIREELASTTATITYDEGKNIEAAVATAKNADVAVLVLGEREGLSGEGSDRSDLNLPDNQEALLEAVSASGVPVVLVLENGRPLSIPWAAAHVPAILEAWYPGEQGGRAVARTLFGDYNPGGKLPVSFPRSVGALPDFYNYAASKSTNYVDGPAAPVFPFGYGLSYTKFDYSNLDVHTYEGKGGPTVTVSVLVANSGDRDGDEVVQVYLHHDVASVSTAARALVGFQRIRLAKGETRTVTFKLGAYELELWGVHRRWEVESGPYTVMVGGSSQSGLKAHFKLTRSTVVGP